MQRSIVLSFTLALAACGADTSEQPNDAPTAESASKRGSTGGVPHQIAALEERNAELTAQIDGLAASLAKLERRLGEAESTLVVHGGSLELHDNALFRADPKGNPSSRIDALEATTDGLEDYADALAGPEAVKAGRIEIDPKTREASPRVQGVVRRLKQRPDLLTAEWDELIDQTIELLSDKPDTWPNHTQVKVESQGHFIDDWQGESAFLKVNQEQIAATVAELDATLSVLGDEVCLLGDTVDKFSAGDPDSGEACEKRTGLCCAN